MTIGDEELVQFIAKYIYECSYLLFSICAMCGINADNVRKPVKQIPSLSSSKAQVRYPPLAVAKDLHVVTLHYRLYDGHNISYGMSHIV